MASFYQPISYLKSQGGKRRVSKKEKKYLLKGGYYPSVMSNLLHHGRMLIPLVLKQGNMLFNSSKKRKTRKTRK